MSYRSVLTLGITVFILEFLLMGLWFYQVQPATQAAIDIFKVIPILFGINLLLGLLFYVVKKPVGLLFLANSILCPLLFYAIWIMWFTYWSR